jgi:hypothetical protein
MRSTRLLGPLAALGLLWLAASAAPAQQVTVTTPFHAVNDSFFERIGGNFNFNINPTPGVGGPGIAFGRPDPNALPGVLPGRNVMDFDRGRGVVVGLAAPGVFTPDLAIPFRQNGFGLAIPQFGGFAPGAGMTSGFQVRGPKGNASFFWEASQGSRRSLVSQAPSVTVTNGYPGYFGDTSQSPFVVGLVPVVGGLSDVFPIGPWPCYTTGCPPYLLAPLAQAMPQGNPRVQAMLRQAAAGTRALNDDPSDPLLAGLPGGGPAAPPRAAGWQADNGLALGGAAMVDVDPGVQRLAAAQASSAGRAVPGVAEARRLRQLEEAAGNDDARASYERGLTAEEGGKPGVAKIYYNMALKSATGEFRAQILARLKDLSAADTPE